MGLISDVEYSFDLQKLYEKHGRRRAEEATEPGRDRRAEGRRRRRHTTGASSPLLARCYAVTRSSNEPSPTACFATSFSSYFDPVLLSSTRTWALL